MIRSLMRKFTNQPAPETGFSEDGRLELAALMVSAARSDGEFDQVEADHIAYVLARRYALPPEEARALRDAAAKLEAEASDSVRFTRALKDHIPLEERDALVQTLWEVVLIDGRRDAHEDGFLRLVSRLLGLNDRESAQARQRAIRLLDQ